MFCNELLETLSEGQLRMAWFMQDGASPHTAHETIAYLRELFNTLLHALGTDHEWSPHSPNLNPLDFWLWRAAKRTIFADKPRSLDDI